MRMIFLSAEREIQWAFQPFGHSRLTFPAGGWPQAGNAISRARLVPMGHRAGSGLVLSGSGSVIAAAAGLRRRLSGMRPARPRYTTSLINNSDNTTWRRVM
jgi:hypothetical protein